MWIVERLLNKLFKYDDIINYRTNPEGDLYLRRWFIWPREPYHVDNKLTPRIYLHKFYTGDNDRHLHDHPWPYRSLILWGGYEEMRFNPEWMKWRVMYGIACEGERKWASPVRWIKNHPQPPQTLSTWYGPGSFLRRGANWAHAVKLPLKKNGQMRHAWSIVWTGVRVRSWGFYTETGWCPWKKYEKGACICGPEEPHNG